MTNDCDYNALDRSFARCKNNTSNFEVLDSSARSKFIINFLRQLRHNEAYKRSTRTDLSGEVTEADSLAFALGFVWNYHFLGYPIITATVPRSLGMRQGKGDSLTAEGGRNTSTGYPSEEDKIATSDRALLQKVSRRSRKELDEKVAPATMKNVCLTLWLWREKVASYITRSVP